MNDKNLPSAEPCFSNKNLPSAEPCFSNKKISNRMNYLIGHLKANLKMLEDDRYCIDVIRQNQAVISALRKVNEMILQNHLGTCVTRAVKGKSDKEKKRVYQEIVEIFKEER